MNIYEKKLSDLIPYKNNPKIHTTEQIEKIAKSIQLTKGLRQPIVVDKNNVIVCGHGRYLASKMLNLDTVPCEVVDNLTEEEIKAYRLIDNRISEGEYDIDLELQELEDVSLDIDMGDFGFEFMSVDEDNFIDDYIEEDDGGYYGDAREKTNEAYNLALIDYDKLSNDFWQMPVIENNEIIPTTLIGFNYAKSSDYKQCGIHFYVDDYQFERVWNAPERYVEILAEYECVLSPDFSLYMDMPMPMKIWNVYRSRMIGQFLQSHGIKVIPTISWAEKETFEFCFKGIQKNSIVSVSTVGVKRDKEALQIWQDGMNEMIRQIQPTTILVYGGKLDYDYGDIKVVYFENQVTENWKERSKSDGRKRI